MTNADLHRGALPNPGAVRRADHMDGRGQRRQALQSIRPSGVTLEGAALGRLPATAADRAALIDGQVNRDASPHTESPGPSLGGGLNLVLVAGAAYFASEHEKGRHGRPHVLCPLCWLNKIAPAPKAPGGSSPAEPPEQA